MALSILGLGLARPAPMIVRIRNFWKSAHQVVLEREALLLKELLKELLEREKRERAEERVRERALLEEERVQEVVLEREALLLKELLEREKRESERELSSRKRESERELSTRKRESERKLSTRKRESERERALHEEERVRERALHEEERVRERALHEEERVRERALLERIIFEKQTRLEEKEVRVEELTIDMARTVAKYVAVLCNRVILDQGLRVGYPDLRTLRKRYDTFLEQCVLCGGRLSAAALDVIQQVLQTEGTEQRDVERELNCFVHNASKQFHYLSLPRGVYCGGDPLTMAAVAALIGLLQRQKWLLDNVDIVGPSGKIVLTAVDGVLRTVDNFKVPA